MEKPLISVIVPIYSTDRYTGLCIESIINQTYKNLEIILIDDGSIDKCPQLCDLYATKDSRIKVIHKQNGGLVSGRKEGMKIASGEYIGYVDGDDWIGQDYFYNIFVEISKNKPDVVVSGWTRALFDQHVVIHNNIENGFYSGELLDQLKSQMISMENFYKPGISTYVWNKVFKRSIVYDCQMNVDNRLMTGEDACVSYAAILKSNSVSIIDNAHYYYRQHEDSMLKRKSNYSNEMAKMRILFEKMQEFSNKQPNLQKQVIDYVLSSCIIRAGGLNPNTKGFVFGNDFENKKVVVYGAGSFGQQLMSKLLEMKICTITGWIDDDYWEYRRSCLDVDPVESVNKFEYDYIIVSSISSDESKLVINRMISFGVDESKIIKLTIPKHIRADMLYKYIYG